jgi:hypothetical protein
VIGEFLAEFMKEVNGSWIFWALLNGEGNCIWVKVLD